MNENRPLREIPLPDYYDYRRELCQKYNFLWPLKNIPFYSNGNHAHVPRPLKQKNGWPWDTESTIYPENNIEMPKISVDIPSYQQGDYIEETIRSIVLQNYPNLELIIIDGGSTDETNSIFEHYKDFISVYISEKDRGQTHAINKGFSLASGDLYYWVNSDDYLNINSLNKVITQFEQDPHLDIIYGDGLTFNEQSKQLGYTFAPFVTERYLRFGSIVLSHSVIWRSKIHCALWEDLHCAMDAELWLRLFKNRRSKHCHFPIGTLRIHANQKTSKMDVWENQWKEDYENFIWKWYPSISPLKWKWRSFEYNYVQIIYRFITGKRKLKQYLVL